MPVAATATEPSPPAVQAARLAHLVLKPDWPRALCGAIVSDHLGLGAPAMDRCHACLAIARARGLGRPGWASK